MNETDIRKYARLMQELDLAGLEVDEKNQTVRLERSTAAQAAPVSILPAGGEAAAAPADRDCVSVTSPMVGTFYAAPAEDAEPFVRAGQRVEKGATLCIIEAMKLMNELPAEEAGVVQEVCVRNGQMVDYGTELFRIRRE